MFFLEFQYVQLSLNAKFNTFTQNKNVYQKLSKMPVRQARIISLSFEEENYK